MADTHGCDTCAFRARYDKAPKSLLGRIWRWHAGWCPGWKKYMTSRTPEQRNALAKQYGMTKYAD